MTVPAITTADGLNVDDKALFQESVPMEGLEVKPPEAEESDREAEFGLGVTVGSSGNSLVMGMFWTVTLASWRGTTGLSLSRSSDWTVSMAESSWPTP